MKWLKLVLILLSAIIFIVLVSITKNIFNIVNDDPKGSFKSAVETLVNTIEQKKLSENDFDPSSINNDNVSKILNISSSNYKSITVVLKENIPYIHIVGAGDWKDLVACGKYNEIKVTNSHDKECDIDLTPPAISVLGDSSITIGAGKPYVDLGAIANDDIDGDLTDEILVDSNVDRTKLGAYRVLYSVVDNAGNKSTATRTVNVIDASAPVISFKINDNQPYKKMANVTVTVNDIYSGIDINSLKYLWSPSKTAPSEINFVKSFLNGEVINPPTGITGEYYLWIFAKDNAGNTIIEKTNVFNLDNIKPIITLIGNSNIILSTGTPYIDEGAIASDNIDQKVQVTISGNVDVNTNGTYKIAYNAVDNSGNVADTVIRTIVIVDSSKPIAFFETNGNSNYSKTESTVVKISDQHSGVDNNSLKYLWNTSTIVPSEASFMTVFNNGDTISTPVGVTGEYYLWILAKDNAGNTAIDRTNVFNLDNVKPIIELIGDNNITIDRGSIYSDLGVTITDNIDKIIPVTTTSTVTPTIIGTYIVTYNAVDSSGNMAIPVTRTINVADISYVASEGVNKPKLVSGMTPIKWNGSTWVDTTESDDTWYNYTTTDKQWANARTADGSMWVWIPRYVYKISSAWHSDHIGKNLLNSRFVLTNYDIDGGTGQYLSGNKTIITNPISVEPNTTYTITRPVNTGLMSARYYGINGIYLGSEPILAGSFSNYTFTTPSDCYYFAFADDANTSNTGYQIEKGNIATTYSAFVSSGTINVQFSKGLDDDWNKGSIGTIAFDNTAEASNNKWTNHPAFTFGDTELTGIWAAKFEASSSEGTANGFTPDATCPIDGDNVTTKTIKIIPNATSWRCLQIGTAFTASRSMETNTVYGWDITEKNIDTHLMKNTEWGAIAYLSKSIYGQNTNEMWINNVQNYTTGCVGFSAGSAYRATCAYAYNSTNGGRASTTGNIYGIYDMTGGASEHVAAYIDNGNDVLEAYGSSIIKADLKYKDIYEVAAEDKMDKNYALTVNKKGDALYETSLAIGGYYAWFSECAVMPLQNGAWFIRGGRFHDGYGAGTFYYSASSGNPTSFNGFRPVLLVDEDL